LGESVFDGPENDTHIVVAAGVEVSSTVLTLTGNVTVAVPVVTVSVTALGTRSANRS
jgi:hypothetical protein